MKRSLVIAATCIFIFSCFVIARADEVSVSDLKSQVSTLQSTVNSLKNKLDELEVKQNAQPKESKSAAPMAGLAEGLTIGGHLKMYLADRSNGEYNDSPVHNDLSAGMHHFYLFITKEIEDWLSLEVQTDTSVSASATPSLTSPGISRATSATTSTSIYQAFMSVKLPQDYELKVGTYNPMFSEEYARELWWHELYHQNNGLAYLQSWHDTGVEVYKNFELSGFSLPVYFDLVNGNKSVDNNEDKMVMLHIAPEFLQGKLRLLGSVGYGKWDDGDTDTLLRSVGGIDLKLGKFNLMSEYLYSKYEDLPLSTTTPGLGFADGKREGYFIKAVYSLSDKWRGLVKFSRAELYKAGILNTMRSDNYDDLVFAVDYFITPNSTIIGQWSHLLADTSDGSASLESDRFTLGWRTTF